MMKEGMDGGYLANLTPEELEALERKKAKVAAALLAKRALVEQAKIETAKSNQKAVWRKKKMYVKGHKVCEANRIYEDAGWYVCEVCSKRFNDIEWIEEHVKTTKHINNMEWYATRPLPDQDEWDEEGPLPQCVQFVEDWFVCTLCNAKAASQVILDAHLNGKEHQKRLLNQDWYSGAAQGEFVLPAYCEFTPSADLPYVCKWCDKKAACVELIVSHLEGKEHTKKSSNIGIPSYGESGHLEAAAAYTNKYGFDVWARQEHWPQWIVDDGQVWKCEQCNKKYITPSSVNEHISNHKSGGMYKGMNSMVKEKFVRNETVHTPTKTAGPSLHSAKPDYHCFLCLLPFQSLAELTKHEDSEMHLQLFSLSDKRAAPQIPAPVMDLMDI